MAYPYRLASALTIAFMFGCGGSPGVSRDASTDGAAGDAGSGTPTATLGSAATTGAVVVAAVDAETGNLIPNAAFALGSAAPATDPNGEATLTGATGRATVHVSAAGHVDWVREVEIGGAPLTITASLVARGATTSVDATGGAVTASPASVVIPPGAFTAATAVGATGFSSSSAARSLPRAQFATADDVSHRVVAAAELTLGQTPAQPISVTLSVPVHTGTVSVWTLGADGEWASPATPTSETTTSATFAVTEPGIYAVALDTPLTSFFHLLDSSDDVGAVVVEDSSTGTATLPDNPTPVPLTAGLVVPDGSVIRTDATGVTLTNPLGDTIRLNVQSEATLAACQSTDCIPGGTNLDVARGAITETSNRAYVNPKPAIRRSLFRTRVVLVGVRGTSFELGDSQCSGSERVIDRVSTFEGMVDVDPVASGLSDVTLSAGQDDELCSDCQPNQVAECTCIDTATVTFPAPAPTSLSFSGSLVGNGTDFCNAGGGALIASLVALPSPLSDNGGTWAPFTGQTAADFDPTSCIGHYHYVINGQAEDDEDFQLVHVDGTIQANVVAVLHGIGAGAGTCTVRFSVKASP